MLLHNQKTASTVSPHQESNPDLPHEEVVILGTSPALLIEGLMQARTGRKVLFIDDAPEPGGAWSTTEAFGIRDIEGACHLMVHYRGTYRVLSELCNIPMEVCVPTPQILSSGRFIPFNARIPVIRRSLSLILRMSLVGLIRCAEALTLNRWRLPSTRDYRFSHATQNLLKRRLIPLTGSEHKRAIQYPVGGSPAMLRKLRSELSQLGARFLQGEVDGIEIGKDKLVQLDLKSTRPLRASQLIVSESASLTRVRDAKGDRKFEAQTNIHTALILRVSGLGAESLSYIELPFDPLVERVADVTRFCKNPPDDGSRILVCENPGTGASGDPNPSPEKIINYLKQERIIPHSVVIEEHHVHSLKLRSGNPSLTQYLQSLPGESIQVVPSRGDLTYSIYRNRRRWENLSRSPNSATQSGS
tara:strand:- start:1271 stop:2518 length:1248 start_codon:yes stop_codon:yes gene_type:complete